MSGPVPREPESNAFLKGPVTASVFWFVGNALPTSSGGFCSTDRIGARRRIGGRNSPDANSGGHCSNEQDDERGHFDLVE